MARWDAGTGARRKEPREAKAGNKYTHGAKNRDGGDRQQTGRPRVTWGNRRRQKAEHRTSKGERRQPRLLPPKGERRKSCCTGLSSPATNTGGDNRTASLPLYRCLPATTAALWLCSWVNRTTRRRSCLITVAGRLLPGRMPWVTCRPGIRRPDRPGKSLYVSASSNENSEINKC